MTLIRSETGAPIVPTPSTDTSYQAPIVNHDAPLALATAPSLEHTVRAWYAAGRSQRAIARELNIDRRKVKRIVDQAA
jgi:hypothetical protein